MGTRPVTEPLLGAEARLEGLDNLMLSEAQASSRRDDG
jgi:hypothetical protein